VRSPSRLRTASTRCSRVLGPASNSVLGYVAHDDDRDAVPFGKLHEPQRRLAYLADGPGRPLELVHGHGLDRVYDQYARPAPRAPGRRSGRTSFSATTRIRSPAAPSSNPAGRLSGRICPADSSPVAYRDVAAGGQARGRLQQQSGLADPGSPRAARQTPARARRPGRGPAPRCRWGCARARTRAGPPGTAEWHPRPVRRPSGARAPCGRVRGPASRRACSRLRRSGTGLPSGDGSRRTPGRRSGFAGEPTPSTSPRVRLRRAASLRRCECQGPPRRFCPPRPSCRGLYLPSRSCSASTSSTMFWMTRRNGLAP